MSDVYEQLRQRLDDLATGFPGTEQKVELRLLRRLFTQDEAEFFLQMSPMLETPAQVAGRLERPEDEVAERMEAMAKKGLLFRLRRPDTVKYAAIPYVVGIFEFQLPRIDAELARDMETYYQLAFGRTIQAHKTPVMRTVPVNRELVSKWPVAPYEDVLKILEDQKTIALADCICRKTARLAGRGCDKPLETCLVFGSHADYYVENGMGRYITVEEAKAVARRSEEAGLVMQPFNSQKVGGMCSCCGDCCGVLRSLKLQPKPAEAVQSNYFAVVDEELCAGCETCVERCQMEAVAVAEDVAVIDLDRCIGCGLCVTTCPTEAMRLERKPEEALYVPPKSGMETYLNIAIERGKL